MNRTSTTRAAVLGGLLSLPLVALFYLGDAFAALPFVPFTIFDWLARVLPGDVITLAIDGIVRAIDLLNLGDTSSAAKAIEQLMAIAVVVIGGMVVGALVALLLRRGSALPGWQLGAGAGTLAMLISLVAAATVGLGGDPLLSALWVAALWIGWGALLGGLIAVPLSDDGYDAGRRTTLTRVAGGSLAVALAAWGAGSLLNSQQRSTGAGQALPGSAGASPRPTGTTAPAPGEALTVDASATPRPDATATAAPLQPEATATTAAEALIPAPGTRPELTPNSDFYRIDINTRPPVIRQEEWALETSGLFDAPRTFTLDELINEFEAVTQPVTMSCISNRIGGDLIGTSNWTGLRMRDFLERLGMQSEAQALLVEAADGFFETIVMEDLMDERTLIVYGMNGETLPVEHGFPLRTYIANRYGMKQPKWITRMEAIDEWQAGYWVVRGWSREARPRIISQIDTIATNQTTEEGLVPVGGIAWAGDRGIVKVEVQVDGDEWQEARLRLPTLSPLTWVLWRYDWPATAGRHTLRVRATDSTGALQIEEPASVRPDGATGYHELTVSV